MRPGDEVAGRYRLDELQGHGPMSEVWRAHDETLERTVALKILSPTADLGRFRREAQALAALAHENIMRVYDYGEDEAGPFMALEWLPGGTLEERLARGPLPPDETHRVATGMAAGLARLHAQGLVHRDLKPANVLFDGEERPKLADFGLARRTAGAGTLTAAGTVLGTAAYISPEQAVGEPAGPASDVYSFGVILFRMLTGALPFVADDVFALVNMHRNVPPPAVETLQPDAPPDLAALTAAALRKDPAQRPADGAALLGALGAAAPTMVSAAADTQATRILAPPPPAAEAPPPADGRGRRPAVLVAAAVVLLAAAGVVLAWAVTRSGGSTPTGTVKVTSAARTHTHPATTQALSTGTTATRSHTTPVQPTTTAAHTTAPTTTTPPTTVPTTVPSTTVPSTTVPTTVPTTTTALGTTTTTATT